MKKISLPEYKRMIKCSMRLQLKKEQSPQTTHVFVKMTTLNSPAFKYYHELFPEFKLMFLTRPIYPTLKSFKKMRDGMSSLHFKLGPADEFWFTHIPFPYEKAEWWDRIHEWHKGGRRKQETIDSSTALGLAGQYDDFLAIKDIFQKRMIYDDFVADPEGNIKDIFEIMELDSKHLPLALEALKEDSQKGTFGRMGNSHIILTDEDIAPCDRVFKEAGLPITCKMPMDDFRKIIY